MVVEELPSLHQPSHFSTKDIIMVQVASVNSFNFVKSFKFERRCGVAKNLNTLLKEHVINTSSISRL